MTEDDEPFSRLKAINALFEHLIDLIFDKYGGCTIGCLIVSTVLIVLLAAGWGVYESYAHANQHCVHATREYVLIGHVETPEDICDTWQNN